MAKAVNRFDVFTGKLERQVIYLSLSARVADCARYVAIAKRNGNPVTWWEEQRDMATALYDEFMGDAGSATEAVGRGVVVPVTELPK